MSWEPERPVLLNNEQHLIDAVDIQTNDTQLHILLNSIICDDVICRYVVNFGADARTDNPCIIYHGCIDDTMNGVFMFGQLGQTEGNDRDEASDYIGPLKASVMCGTDCVQV